jgi:hypothetical protein
LRHARLLHRSVQLHPKIEAFACAARSQTKFKGGD